MPPSNFARPGALVAAVGVLWLVLNEISDLSGQFLTKTGSFSTFNELGGPTSWTYLSHWRDVLGDAHLGQWKHLLFVYVVLDVAFIILYRYCLRALLRAVTGVTDHWLNRVILALVVCDLLEDATWLWWGHHVRTGDDLIPHWAVYVMTAVTVLKWALVAGLGIAALSFVVQSWDTVQRRVRQLASAVYIQRFSLLTFLPLAILSVVPLAKLNNVFDQMPDVQRAWTESRTGAWYWFAAGLVFGVVVLPSMFFLGRLRADWAYRRTTDPLWPYHDPPAAGEADNTARRQGFTFWVTGPVLLGLLAWGTVAFTDGKVFGWRLLIFCGVPVVIIGVSLVLRGRGIEKLEVLPVRGPEYARDVLAVGDIFTVAAVSLTGFGLIRAFTDETALVRLKMLEVPRGDSWGHPELPLLAGVAFAILPWVISYATLTWVTDTVSGWTWLPDRVSQLAAAEGAAPLGGAGGTPYGFLVGTTILFLALAAFPRWFAYTAHDVGLGVLGAGTLALGTLTVMLGAVVAYAQARQPPELVQVLRIVPRPQWYWHRLRNEPVPGWLEGAWRRFRATPVISMMALTVLATALIGSRTDVHPVISAGTIPPRPTLIQAFGSWVAQEGGCRVRYPDHKNITIRPMVMYGAEGGGIRATYWTASALQTIASAGKGCGRNSTFFSGGASGGALGLTLARFDPNPLDLTKAISGQESLGAAAVSLATSDVLASAAGIRFAASTPGRTPNPQLLDRAGLMETAWEAKSELAGLRTPYLPTQGVSDAPAAVTGQLILTSTEARDGCHGVLSQVDLSTNQTYDNGWPHCGGSAAGPDSWDVFNAYGAHQASDDPQNGGHCLGDVPALTAGLLASRFPYVTPSGVIGPCNGLNPLQMIDGGYTDNTGLGTITGLASQWEPLVRAHNDQVLQDRQGELIVPLVVFLDNGAGADYSVTQDGLVSERADQTGQASKTGGDWTFGNHSIPEFLVPPVGIHNARDHKVRANLALAEARNDIRTALCTPPAREGATTADHATRMCLNLLNRYRANHAVFVVHQAAQPSIAAPLGWTLSKASMADLDADMTTQEQHGCRHLPVNPAGRHCYGSLYNLLRALGVNEGGVNDVE